MEKTGGPRREPCYSDCATPRLRAETQDCSKAPKAHRMLAPKGKDQCWHPESQPDETDHPLGLVRPVKIPSVQSHKHRPSPEKRPPECRGNDPQPEITRSHNMAARPGRTKMQTAQSFWVPPLPDGDAARSHCSSKGRLIAETSDMVESGVRQTSCLKRFNRHEHCQMDRTRRRIGARTSGHCCRAPSAKNLSAICVRLRRDRGLFFARLPPCARGARCGCHAQ